MISWGDDVYHNLRGDMCCHVDLYVNILEYNIMIYGTMIGYNCMFV